MTSHTIVYFIVVIVTDVGVSVLDIGEDDVDVNGSKSVIDRPPTVTIAEIEDGFVIS